MYESKPYLYGTGRRKHSVARVRVYPGTGNITVNGRDIDDYFGLETLKLIVRQPMTLTDTLGKFDIVWHRRRRRRFRVRPARSATASPARSSSIRMRCARSSRRRGS